MNPLGKLRLSTKLALGIAIPSLVWFVAFGTWEATSQSVPMVIDHHFLADVIRDGAYVLALSLILSFLAEHHLKRISQMQDQRERLLREMRDRLQLAVDAKEMAVWEWNLATDVLTWDARMFEIYRLPPTPDGRVPYHEWISRVHPEDIPKQTQSFKQTLKSGRSYRDFRLQFTDPDEVRHIESAAMVVTNEQGVAVKVVGINCDVTESRAAALKLEASERWHRQLFLSTNDAVFVRRFDPSGQDTRFVAVNDIACQWLGYTREEMLNLTPTDIDADEVRDLHPGFMRQLRADRQCAWEGVHRTKDGRKLPVHVNARLISVDGDTYIIAAVRDLNLIARPPCELPTDLQGVLDQVDRPAVTMDERGTILFANQALLVRTGYERTSLVGQNWFQVFSRPGSGGNVRYHEMLLSGQVAPTEFVSLMTKDGQWISINFKNQIRRDSRGRVIGLARIEVPAADK